jgi:hypothetical protein
LPLKFFTPGLNNEYSLLCPSLYVVGHVLQQEKLENEIAEQELEVIQCQRGASQADTSVKHAILDTIAKALPERDPAIRQTVFRKLLNDFRETTATPGDLASRQKRERISGQIMELYGGLKTDLFEADFGAVANTGDDKTLADALGASRKRLESLKVKLEGHRKNLAKCFARGLPEEWKGHRIVKTVDTEKFKQDQKQLADRIVRAFAADWRSRAPLFQEPVSVHGTAIRSMTTERKAVWSDAYDRMKLGELKKRPVYSPIIEPRVTIQPIPKGDFFQVSKEPVKA